MAHMYPNAPFCKCLLAHIHQPSCWLGTPSLAHCLPPGPPHNLLKSGANIVPGSNSSVLEEVLKPEIEHGVVVEDDNDQNYDDDEDEDDRASTQICLFLRKNMDVRADVDLGSSVNWISEKLLRNSGIDVVPTKYVTYQGSDGIRLESRGSVKVRWRRSVRDRTFPGEFIVHAGKPGASDLILGKPWAETHGKGVLRSRRFDDSSRGCKAQRQSERGQRGEVPRVRIGTPSVSGRRITKLAQRPRINHRSMDAPR